MLTFMISLLMTDNVSLPPISDILNQASDSVNHHHHHHHQPANGYQGHQGNYQSSPPSQSVYKGLPLPLTLPYQPLPSQSSLQLFQLHPQTHQHSSPHSAGPLSSIPQGGSTPPNLMNKLPHFSHASTKNHPGLNSNSNYNYQTLPSLYKVNSNEGTTSLPSSKLSLSPSFDTKNTAEIKRKTRNNLPKETTYILLKWLNDHLNHPYPNSFEKNQLMVSTGLNQQQLSNWFINARRRKIKVLKEQQRLNI